jgi:hypothetical protein
MTVSPFLELLKLHHHNYHCHHHHHHHHHRCIEKKTNCMSLNTLLRLWYTQHVSGTSMPIIRSWKLYVCCYHLWCAVLGYWLLGVRCRAAGYASRKRDVARPRRATSLFPDAQPAACTWPPTTRNQALHTIGGNSTHIVSSSWWWA